LGVPEWEPRRATRLGSLREHLLYLWCTNCIEGPPRQLLARLQSTIDANFRNDCSGSSEIKPLEPFQWLRGVFTMRRILSSYSSSLAYWNLCWTVLKPYILPQCKWLILGIQRTELFVLLSVQHEGLRWSIILRTRFQHRGHFENMTVY